ncbi:MAG: hypothetical protein F4Z74_02125 [Acidobacteria bacterium]|nr:hypothetical protein [Acidobacteriota bacterium]MYE42678.1 hypothetical protein [Acidobacteriota bacterium]
MTPVRAALTGEEDGRDALPLGFAIGVAASAILCAPVAIVIGLVARHENPSAAQLATIPNEHAATYLRGFQEGSKSVKRRFAIWFGVGAWAIFAALLYYLGTL